MQTIPQWVACLKEWLPSFLFYILLGITCLYLTQQRREVEQKVALLWMKDSALFWILNPHICPIKSQQIMKNTNLKYQESKMISSFSLVLSHQNPERHNFTET